MQTHHSSSEVTTISNLSRVKAAEVKDSTSAVAQYLTARDTLVRRRQELESELAAIKAAFEQGVFSAEPAEVAPTAVASPQRMRGQITSTVVEILKSGPLTKDEIIEKLKALGPAFGSNPRLVADSVLYGRRFRRTGKVFSLAEGTG